jgi:hypothetical protein
MTPAPDEHGARGQDRGERDAQQHDVDQTDHHHRRDQRQSAGAEADQ